MSKKMNRVPLPNLTHRRFYKERSTWDVANALAIMEVSRINLFIDNADKLVTLGRIFGGPIFMRLLKYTAGRFFTAGENYKEAIKFVKTINPLNLVDALYYMGESSKNETEEKRDQNLDKFLTSFLLKDVAQNPDFFSVIKISALIDMDLLRKAGDKQQLLDNLFTQSDPITGIDGFKKVSVAALAATIKKSLPLETDDDILEFIKKIRFDFNKDEEHLTLIEFRLKCGCFNLVNKDMNEHPIFKKLVEFSPAEQQEIDRALNRVKRILAEAQRTSSKIIFDGEQTYIQRAINIAVEQLMMIYNFGKTTPLITHTFQAYLLITSNFVEYEISKARFLGPEYPLSMKLVRGGYLEEERKEAKKNGTKTVFDTKAETDESYNANAQKILESIGKKGRFLLATHNDLSFDMIAEQVLDGGQYSEKRENVYFATLNGLNDPLCFRSLTLGLKTLRYLPFAEKEVMLPYLIRRAKEDKKIIQEAKLQREMLWDELKHRLPFASPKD